MYAEYLEYAGFYAAHECAADDAFAAACALKPDVVVTDLALSSRGDGLSLIRQLRSHAETARMCIVVVSAFATMNSRQKAHDAGADVFLLKPCLPEKLVRELRRILDAKPDNACGA